MCQGGVEFESIELAHLIDVPRVFRAPSWQQLRAAWPTWAWWRSTDAAIQVTAHGLVLRARRRHGVRPPPAGRPGAGALFAHHLRVDVRPRRQRHAAGPGRRAALRGDVRRALRRRLGAGRAQPRSRWRFHLARAAGYAVAGARGRVQRGCAGRAGRQCSPALAAACGRWLHVAALGAGALAAVAGPPAGLDGAPGPPPVRAGTRRRRLAAHAAARSRGCGRAPVGGLAVRPAAVGAAGGGAGQRCRSAARRRWPASRSASAPGLVPGPWALVAPAGRSRDAGRRARLAVRGRGCCCRGRVGLGAGPRPVAAGRRLLLPRSDEAGLRRLK